MRVRLHVNVDHVATIRQARGTEYPDPVEAAMLCEWAGAHGITVHLREDRRHIQLRDVEVLRRTVKTMLNLEMAATEEMVRIALQVRPDLVTLVPERREERTTEGGLDVRGQLAALRNVRERLDATGIPTSLFVDPDEDQVQASIETGAAMIELHTGDYAEEARRGHETTELDRLARAASYARVHAPSMKVAAGHGLTARNVVPLVARVPELVELNIGHALISDAVLVGLDRAVQRFLRAIEEGEQLR
ncbi:pyridoxine 5'-phosphate synthase [Sandaracinus amylolyticus]|uniref:pyridoxine 5'-phosphate synthase n=1 Tax=Sandaracinus amylolyticus TaxID=927083 RepID=UPI001EFFA403|nr:pyridoxine 5'-phosphate synthase [Sandaracinus amylolyticus]UJR80772.1 Pyridoxine 5'-phosphate synthase PdxJ [Sandaracinus amylolyticus]